MNFDWGILHAIQDYIACPLLDFIMPKITVLGSGAIIWLLAAAALLCTKKYRRQGVLLLCGLFVAFLTGNLFLKNLVARPRPCWLDPSVQMLVSIPKDYSFPSGHSMCSAIGAMMLTNANRKFGLVAIPLAILIAFSRMYLYVHFPTDVLCGAALGIAIAALVLYIDSRLRKKVNA